MEYMDGTPSIPTADFHVVDDHSLFLLQPITAAAAGWITEHLPADAMMFGSAIVIEHRYVEDILDGITGDGLTWAWS
jgi:hypothetical protein